MLIVKFNSGCHTAVIHWSLFESLPRPFLVRQGCLALSSQLFQGIQSYYQTLILRFTVEAITQFCLLVFLTFFVLIGWCTVKRCSTISLESLRQRQYASRPIPRKSYRACRFASQYLWALWDTLIFLPVKGEGSGLMRFCVWLKQVGKSPRQTFNLLAVMHLRIFRHTSCDRERRVVILSAFIHASSR